jgi:hypothetical protein
VKKCLKDAEEILQKQRKAEEEFLKILREFDPEKPEESFKKLWVSERCYEDHIKTRIEEGVVINTKDYLEKILQTLSQYTSVYYAHYSTSWDRIFYDKKRQWMVVLTENGRIITSYKIKEPLRETFRKIKKKANLSGQTVKIIKGKPNEELKKESERILKNIQRKK